MIFPPFLAKRVGLFLKKIGMMEENKKKSHQFAPASPSKMYAAQSKNGRSYDMGLIKAGLGAVGGNLADQWKEY